jgi:hypothetical protein
MALLLESLNDAVEDNQEPAGCWSEFAQLLKRDFAIHQWLVRYWSCWGHSESEMENAFAITPRMRQIAVEMNDAGQEAE